jgi:phage-related minor tail protein
VARRRRSYRKNSDDLLGTFVNNAIASSQKRATADRKAREAAARRAKTAEDRARRRAAKEAEQEQKRRDREAERRRKAAEREAEARRKAEEKEQARQRREQEKLDEKISKVFSRVLLELETEGLFPGETTALRIAREAVEKSVTPAQAKKYFISPKLDAVARECAMDYLEERIECEERFRSSEDYQQLASFVAGFRPQSESESSVEYTSLRTTFEAGVTAQLEQEALEEREQQEKERRELERKELFEELVASKSMFPDELEEFVELISDSDLSGNQARDSEEYAKFVANKTEYWASINAQLSEFDL